MHKETPKILGIVVITWDNYSDTKDLLVSLQRQTYKDFSIVVVEGNTKNSSLAKLKVEFKDFTYIQLVEDRGYSGSSNVGIKYFLEYNYPYILVINNDVTLSENTIEMLLSEIQKSNVFAVGPLMHSYYNRSLVQVGGSLVNIVTSNPTSIWKNVNDLEDKYKVPYEVKKLPGACILFDTRVFRKIGFFDETFFLYYGDTDFQKRMRDSHLRQFIVPQAKATHKVSATTKKDITKLVYYETKGFLQYINKHYNIFILSYSLVNFYITRVKYYLYSTRDLKIKIATVKNITRAVIDFIKNKRGKSL